MHRHDEIKFEVQDRAARALISHVADDEPCMHPFNVGRRTESCTANVLMSYPQREVFWWYLQTHPREDVETHTLAMRQRTLPNEDKSEIYSLILG